MTTWWGHVRGSGRLLVVGAVALSIIAPLLTIATVSTAAAEGEGFKGTLVNRDDGEPVAGVTITAVDGSGADAGSTTTADDGTFLLEVPGPGDYTVTLDKSSLPDGVELTNPKQVTRTVSLATGQQRTLVFAFGESTTKTVSTLDRIPSLVLDGLRLGLILAMTAIGLSLIYGTTQFTNFAHGEMVTFGALITWYLNHDGGLPLVVAAILGVILSGGAGYALDKALWTPLRRRSTSPFGLMVVSFGLSIMAINVFQFFFGTRTRPFTQYVIQKPLFVLGTQNVPPKAIWIIVISVVSLGAVGLFLQRARFGKAVRAVADNRPLASASGIDTERVVRLVWILGSALAGLGGILYSTEFQVKFDEGQTLLLLMFAGITLGGLGTSFGAAAGCVILGVAIQLSTLWIPASLKNVGAMVVLILVLMFRPQGVFGQKERVG